MTRAHKQCQFALLPPRVRQALLYDDAPAMLLNDNSRRIPKKLNLQPYLLINDLVLGLEAKVGGCKLRAAHSTMSRGALQTMAHNLNAHLYVWQP